MINEVLKYLARNIILDASFFNEKLFLISRTKGLGTNLKKCICILCRVVYYMYGVPSWGPSNQLSSRTSHTSGHKRYRVVRVVRVDTSVVKSTKNIVEWKNAFH